MIFRKTDINKLKQNKSQNYLGYSQIKQIFRKCENYQIKQEKLGSNSVKSEFHKLGPNEYPNIFRWPRVDRTNIRIYSGTKELT